MGRLIDIDNLKGCAIIRPTSHESIEHIKQCGDDVLNHNDIPTAYDVEKVVAELEKAYPINPYPNSFSNGRDLAIKKAIDIVRKGGAS